MSEVLIRDEPLTDTATVSERLPFDPFHIREMEEYLSEMSSNGLQLSKKRKNKLIFIKTEPQEMSYRLLLGDLKTVDKLTDTLKASGWKFVRSLKSKTMTETKIFYVFANANTLQNDSVFQENNRKYAASLSPTREFTIEALLYLPLLCFYIYIIWTFFYSSRVELIPFAIACTLMQYIDLFVSYKAKLGFIETYHHQQDSTKIEIPNWRKLRADAERLFNLQFIGLLVCATLIYFISSAMLKSL